MLQLAQVIFKQLGDDLTTFTTVPKWCERYEPFLEVVSPNVLKFKQFAKIKVETLVQMDNPEFKRLLQCPHVKHIYRAFIEGHSDYVFSQAIQIKVQAVCNVYQKTEKNVPRTDKHFQKVWMETKQKDFVFSSLYRCCPEDLLIPNHMELALTGQKVGLEEKALAGPRWDIQCARESCIKTCKEKLGDLKPTMYSFPGCYVLSLWVLLIARPIPAPASCRACAVFRMSLRFRSFRFSRNWPSVSDCGCSNVSAVFCCDVMCRISAMV